MDGTVDAIVLGKWEDEGCRYDSASMTGRDGDDKRNSVSCRPRW